VEISHRFLLTDIDCTDETETALTAQISNWSFFEHHFLVAAVGEKQIYCSVHFY
jgi:hypothetical protein